MLDMFIFEREHLKLNFDELNSGVQKKERRG